VDPTIAHRVDDVLAAGFGAGRACAVSLLSTDASALFAA
jgi:hypothetical protein